MIDCDVHNVVGPVSTLEPYLDDHWREVIETSQFSGPTDQPHPPNLAISQRSDLEPVDGLAPGRTLASVRQQLLDPLALEFAILSCDYGVESVRNPDAAAALAAAVNDWQVAEWLDPEPRLRAAIVVPSQQPAMAAAEIKRMASHPGFVSVYLPVRSAVPYGNRNWWPLLATAVEHDLVVELHFGGSPGLPPTASGWPTSWMEEYVDMASAFQAQLTSLVVEGVFDEFPTLRVSLMESGFAWIPGFLWRLDKGWRGLRREVPWTKRLPSEYIHDHVRVALQPVDGPADAKEMLKVTEQMGLADMLMFSSDYPHRHSEEELAALPTGLGELVGDRILAGAARDHYRLP